MELNGKTLPQITVGWDSQDQTVHVATADTAFRNLDFVLAILQMACRTVESSQRQQALQALQSQGLTKDEEEVTRRILRR